MGLYPIFERRKAEGSEETEHQDEIAEAALAHVIKDTIEAAYRRGNLLDKRRSLMQDWADCCTRA